MENPGKDEGFDPACPKHINRLRVVAEDQNTSFSRSPPQALFAECEIPIRDFGGNVSVQQPKLIGCRNGSGRAWRRPIQRADQILDGLGKTRSGRGVLIFAAHIKREAPCSGVSGEAVIAVETLLIRAAVIVDTRL